jgi:hypothetical protein
MCILQLKGALKNFPGFDGRFSTICLITEKTAARFYISIKRAFYKMKNSTYVRHYIGRLRRKNYAEAE